MNISGWFYCSGSFTHGKLCGQDCNKKLFYVEPIIDGKDNLRIVIKCSKCDSINELTDKYIKRI